MASEQADNRCRGAVAAEADDQGAGDQRGPGKFTEAWTQTSLFAPVKTQTKEKQVARRRTVERAVQLSLF